MKKIIAFGASTSQNSINKKLVTYASSLLEGLRVEILDLNDFSAPLYSIDEEKAKGIPPSAHAFRAKLDNADGFLISVAEHNGNFTAAFKSLYDWCSRIDTSIFDGKNILLLSTSPGSRGAASAMAIAKDSFSRMEGKIIGEFSLPHFSDNFTAGKITDEDLDNKLIQQVKAFEKSLLAL